VGVVVGSPSPSLIYYIATAVSARQARFLTPPLPSFEPFRLRAMPFWVTRASRTREAPDISLARLTLCVTVSGYRCLLRFCLVICLVICLATSGLLTLTGRDTGSVCRHTCAHKHAHRGGRLGARTWGSTGASHCGGTSFVTPAVWYAGSDFVAGRRGTRGRVGVDVAVPVVAVAACTCTHTHRAVRRLVPRVLTLLECSLHRYLPSDVFAATQVIAAS